jgi:hypothetical protein
MPSTGHDQRGEQAAVSGPEPPVTRRQGRLATRQLALIVAGAVVTFAGIGGYVGLQTWNHARGLARTDAAFQATWPQHAIEDALTLGKTTLAAVSGNFPAAAVIATPDECQLLFNQSSSDVVAFHRPIDRSAGDCPREPGKWWNR